MALRMEDGRVQSGLFEAVKDCQWPPIPSNIQQQRVLDLIASLRHATKLIIHVLSIFQSISGTAGGAIAGLCLLYLPYPPLKLEKTLRARGADAYCDFVKTRFTPRSFILTFSSPSFSHLIVLLFATPNLDFLGCQIAAVTSFKYLKSYSHQN